jgi:hypothetical protein
VALLVGLVDAAAVAGREADALVVVAHEARDAAVSDKRRDLVRVRSVADEVAEAEHVADAATLDVRQDCLEVGQVAVHLRKDGERTLQDDLSYDDLAFSNQASVV